MVEGKNSCAGYGCYGFDNVLTECDGSNSDSVHVGLHVGSDKKPGLGLAVDCVSVKPRVTKMEGKDNKSASKKRSKPAQIGFNSDDDEPIGSLFKLISKKKTKKSKAVSGVVGEKGLDADIFSEKLLAVDEDLGGMDDTLASFRKKLRAPKKDAGSGITGGRNAESMNGPLKGSVLAFETKVVGNSEVVMEDGFGGRIDKEVDDISEEKIKDFKGALKPPKSRGHNGSHEALDGQGSGNNSIQNEKEHSLGLNKGPGASLDDNFEDPLSASLRKAKLELTEKSQGYLRSRQRRETQAPENELNIDDMSGLVDLLPAVRRRSQTASNLDQKTLDCDNSLHEASSRDPIDLTDSLDKIGMQQTMCNNAMLEISSTTMITEMKVRSSDGMQGGRAEAILEDSVPISFLQRSCSSLSACSRKTEGPKEGDADRKKGTSLDNHVLNDGELVEFHSTKLKEGCSLQSQGRALENQASEVGIRAIDLAHVAAEMPNSISVPMKAEEIHQFDSGLSNLGFNSAVSQHSKSLSTNFISSRDENTCISGKEVQKTCFDDDLLDRRFEDASQDIASNSSKEDIPISQSNLSPLISCGVHKFDSAVPMKHQVKSSETVDNSCHLSPECVPSEFVTSGSGEVNGSSSPSTTPDRNESCAPGKGHLHDMKVKNKKQLVVQRITRKSKKRRHGDMAYEGDADWEMLIHEQGFLDNCLAGDEDQSLKVREKFRSASNVVIEAENGGMAAVSAGLKACAVGPVEKIKFKDVLKRKGGLQEYLQCRNKILGLWGKDVTRVLPLTECGVTASPSADEPPLASLIREIYAFLDQSGYINVGVASEKDRTDSSGMHNFKLLKGKNFGEKAGAHDADTDDGVSFILGKERSSELCMVQENGDTVGVQQNQLAGVIKNGKADSLHVMELSNFTGHDECRAAELRENASIDTKSHDREVNLNVLNSNLSGTVVGSTEVSVINPDPGKHINDVQSVSSDSREENHGMQSDPESRKKVIVIGAGPAGLTAARHLQRQGFLVTVLEGRSRIGGRVYTDRSSLSVPVDLGASIITGVEADVATERRPDPSSLICAQLGLELTVLNSDCPLYDIVTGQKVPADLDEALEAEYNTLLDDMLLVVAQKGERAMKMSLEEGLEYGLKRRRMARLGRNYVESGLCNFPEALLASGKDSYDGEVSDDISSAEEILSPLERRVMNWHYAHLEYGCAALLKEVSLPYWNQDDIYGGFGGAHCMIKGGYSTVIESLGEGLCIHLNHVVTDIKYCRKEFRGKDDCSNNVVKVLTSNGREFSGDAVLITVPLGCLKAEAIKFSPPLPQWKNLSIQRLGFGVLNKVVLEFPEVFWDESVDYFGATAEETSQRGQCFMFWNVKKTVGAPVLIALVVGKAAIDGQNMSAPYHVTHALTVLRKLFGEAAVPNPVASVVTDWGKDPFSYGSYSYVAVGASGEDYDILGRPVENCLFFAGEATCKEHPDTVGGAMMSGLREAVRIIDILNTGNDYTAEVEALEAARQHSDNERNEVRDIVKRLEAVEISNVLYKESLDRAEILTREALLQDMFTHAKTTAGRLHLAKELLKLPVEVLKSFAGTKNGLSTLNSWMLDSMGKDGTQLLRHCVRLLVLVSTDLLAVRMSGIGKTVKEKVCVHTSRDIRAIASQLVNMWIEVFRKEKASNGGLKLLRQSAAGDSLKSKSLVSGKPPIRMHHALPDNKGSSQPPAAAKNNLPPSANVKRISKTVKLETPKLEAKSSMSQSSVGREDAKGEEDYNYMMSEEEQAAYAAAEAARAAALAAAEAYASSEAQCNTSLPLPKIMSFHKFLRREQYTQMDESDIRRKWSGGALGRQDCISEIDSRNCRVRDWSVDFSAACVNLDNSKMSVDNLSQQSHSNDIANQLNLREQSAESAAVDSSIFTKAWVDADGSNGVKDYNAIDRWQSQAAAADSDFFHRTMQIRDEEDSNISFKLPSRKPEQLPNESSVSQVTINKELVANQSRGPERIKQAVVDYVASLLMPLYKAKKIDKEGYKSIMKKTATKVMEQTTDAEKAMAIYEFLDFKRKNKIRAFVDKLIERHMATKPDVKP